MKSFKTYIYEEAQKPKQVKHLTHTEDLPLHHGHEGTESALRGLESAHEHIKSGNHSSHLTTKYDGSPSIVYGHHPKTGKFFVASKSAFNETPKINHTEEDIDRNHGHAPGLANKLKHALRHLPKIAPKKGVYQGDMMFSSEDVHHDPKRGTASFNPNPSGLTYTAKGEEAKKVKKAKIGVVTHLAYHGKDIKDMSASPHVDHDNFKQHPDVHTIDPRVDTSKVKYTEEAQKAFRKHIDAAKAIHHEHGKVMYAATRKHQGEGGHLERYINDTVRTGETPSAEGFKAHLAKRYGAEAEKLKSETGKAKKAKELADHHAHIDANKEHYDNLFKMHGHLQKAKNVLIDTLNQHQDLEHHHNGEAANPEGYVHHAPDGQIHKFVKRDEFSRRNLTGMRPK